LFKKSDEAFALEKTEAAMPTLSRLIIALVVLSGLAVAGVYALGTFVTPEPHEITVRLKMDGFGR
jgi:hypothetical protein